MSRFFNLIKNEFMKIHSQKSTFVMMLILIVLVSLGGGLSNSKTGKLIPGSEGDWKTKVEKDMQLLKEKMEKQPLDSQIELEKEIAIDEYQLKNNIPPKDRTLWSFVSGSKNLIVVVSLFVIIVAGGIVAGEFSQGTAKLLLIRPYKRWKILLSKYITVMITGIEFLILLFVSSTVVGSIIFGTEGLTTPSLDFIGGRVIEKSILLDIVGLYGLASINIVMFATMAFMISTVFRNSALAVGLSIFLLFTGLTSVMLLAGYGIPWAKYILFANTDLTMYFEGSPLFPGMSMAFSIVILLFHFIVFNAISFVTFAKRDIAT